MTHKNIHDVQLRVSTCIVTFVWFSHEIQFTWEINTYIHNTHSQVVESDGKRKIKTKYVCQQNVSTLFPLSTWYVIAIVNDDDELIIPVRTSLMIRTISLVHRKLTQHECIRYLWEFQIFFSSFPFNKIQMRRIEMRLGVCMR